MIFWDPNPILSTQGFKYYVIFVKKFLKIHLVLSNKVEIRVIEVESS